MALLKYFEYHWMDTYLSSVSQNTTPWDSFEGTDFLHSKEEPKAKEF